MIFFLLVVVLFLVIFYKVNVSQRRYWLSNGVPYIDPKPIVGNASSLILQSKTTSKWVEDIYIQHKDKPYFGIHMFWHPTLVVNDPELIDAILSKDFVYFSSRTVAYAPEVVPGFNEGLMFLRNPEWKHTKAKLNKLMSPSIGRKCFPLLTDICNRLINHIELETEKGQLTTYPLCRLYMTEVAVSLFFGLDAQCFSNKNSPFISLAMKIFQQNFTAAARQFTYFFMPSLVHLLKISFFDMEVINEIKHYVNLSFKQKQESNTKRGDLVDFLLDLQRESKIKEEYLFTENVAKAQPSAFFSAGVATSAATLLFLLYELSIDKSVQETLREEINTHTSDKGEIHFDNIQYMEYLEAVLCETLRKYPVLPFLDRECVEDYTLRGTNLKLTKGARILIPVYGLHFDPNIYADPKKFDPDRFLGENKIKINKSLYLPFGRGPRFCLGKNIAKIAIKLAVCRILLKYEVTYDGPPMEFTKKSVFIEPGIDVAINFKKL